MRGTAYNKVNLSRFRVPRSRAFLVAAFFVAEVGEMRVTVAGGQDLPGERDVCVQA